MKKNNIKNNNNLKSRFMKNFLTTASVMVISSSASQAMAENYLATGAAQLSNKANLRTAAGAAAGAPIANGDLIITNANAVTADHNNASIKIELLGSNSDFTVNNNLTITEITNNVANVALANTLKENGIDAIAFGVAGNAVLNSNVAAANTLTLGTFGTNLGTVALAGAGSTVKFDGANQTVTKDITATVGGKGAVIVNANNVTLGKIGAVGNSLDTVTITAGNSAIFNGAVVANGAITLGAGSSVTVKDDKNITASDITGAAADNGILTFEGKSTVPGTIGNTHKLNKISINNGAVNLGAFAVKATTISFDNANAGLVAAGSTVTGDIVASADGNGKLTVSGGNVAFNGTIGASDKRISNIYFATDNKLSIDGASINALTVTTAATNTGAIEIKSKAFTLNSDVGTKDLKLSKMTINDAANDAVVTVSKGSKLYFGHADGINFVSNQDNSLVMQDGAEINAAITTANDKQGTLKIEGKNKVIGNIGDAAKALKALHFTTDGVLSVGSDEVKIYAPITGVEGQNGAGRIIFEGAANKALNIYGAIGDVASDTKSLAGIEVKNGGKVTLHEAAHIKQIDFGSSNESILELNKANASYKIAGFSNKDAIGKVEISEDAITIKAGSNFGASNQKLHSIKLGKVAGNDFQLNIEDGINFYLSDGFNNTAVGTGKIDFQGDSTVDAVIGKNNAYGEVKISGANKQVLFKQSVNATAVLVGNDAKAVFLGAVSGNIGPVNANNGSVEFKNAANIVLTGNVGGGNNTLKTFIVSGKDIDFTYGGGNHAIDELHFKSDAATKLTFTKIGGIGNTKIITNDVAHIIQDNEGNAAVIFAKAVGDAANNAVTFVMKADNDSTYTIKADTFFGNIKSSHQKGTVVFGDANGVASAVNIGEKAAELKMVNFVGATSHVHGDIYSKNLQIATVGTVNFHGSVNVSDAAGVNFTKDGTINIKNVSKLGSIVTTTNVSEGTIIFEGPIVLSKNLGANAAGLKKIEFSENAGGKILVSGDHYAENIIFKKAQLEFSGNVTLGGDSNFTSTAIELGTNKLTIGSNVTSSMNGATTISTSLSADSKTIGTIHLGTGDLSMTGATSLTINVKDNDTMPSAKQEFDLITKAVAAGNVIGLPAGVEAKINKTNRFVSWSYDKDTHKLSRISDAANSVKDIFKNNKDSELMADANLLINPKNSNEAKEIVQDLSKMTDDTKIANSIERLTKPVSDAPQVVNAAVTSAVQSTLNRLNSLATPNVAPAAGDDIDRHGVWFTPFYANITSKQNGAVSGSKSKVSGGTIGIDTMANDTTTIGIAGSFIRSDMKNNGFRAGDTSKIDSLVFSAYSIFDLGNSWYLQGAATFASSKTKSRAIRVTSTGNVIASGSYDGTTIGFESLAGYNFAPTSNVVITPAVGLGFTRYTDGGYKETGAGAYNVSVSKKDINRAELIAGMKAKLSNFYESDDISITPEVRAFVRHDVIAKSVKSNVVIGGMNSSLTTKLIKPVKTTLNLGLGLNAKYDQFEYGVSYDANMAKKYSAHQGTLKIRVNF